MDRPLNNAVSKTKFFNRFAHFYNITEEFKMTYEKAKNALIEDGLMKEERTEAVIMASKGHSVAFT